MVSNLNSLVSLCQCECTPKVVGKAVHSTRFLHLQLNKAIQEKEDELKEQLLIQTEAHTQHLSEALQTQAEQLGVKWVSQLEAKLIQQEGYYQTKLAKAMARLRGIETMVETVANAGMTYSHVNEYKCCFVGM